jgi:hypothetical protein
MPALEKGDHVVYTDEKLKKTLNRIIKNLTGTYMYESEMKKFNKMKNEVYIVSGWFAKDSFSAQFNGKTYCGFLINDFRTATLKEKRMHKLMKIYNK